MDSIQSPAAPDESAYRRFLSRLDYLPAADAGRIEAAYAFAARAHAGQTRLSGEPYVTHPLAVASAVVEWRMDAGAIMAALLHDVLEDTGTSKSELAERFGREVAELVDGLSKLDKIEFASYQEAQAENFRKMLMAMARDLRVVLIKLADRQHNLRTMSALRPEKRRRIARETLEIYAPIALRLGLNKLYREMQDTCLELIHPHRAGVLKKAMEAAYGNRRELLTRILDGMNGKLAEAGLSAEVFGRAKSLYSIYNKMKDKHLSFSQVLDIYGFRVVVDNEPACYLALGALHALYKPVPGKFKDYIALPKANGYQSLHTTLIGPYGTPVEVQIRTSEMHRIAQEGVAAHWLYKDGDTVGMADLQLKTHKWLQSLLEMQNGDSSEFFENVKIDLFPDEVYIFTPKGKILALPSGATAIDFAYAVHTDVGNHCAAARINGELSALRTELKSGDTVEILTRPEAAPKPEWLNHVRTGRARSRIRHFLRTVHNEESATLGQRLLNSELLALGVVPATISQSVWDKLLKANGDTSQQALYSEIGLGIRSPAVVARRLLAREDTPAAAAGGTLLINGSEGMAVQLAHCCQPIPGDLIVGSIKKGRGLVVHSRDCPHIRRSRANEPAKWLEVEWAPEEGRLFDVRIRVEVEKRRGVLAQVAALIAEAGSNIEDVSMDARPEHLLTVLYFTVQVSDRIHLARIMRSLRRLPIVSRIARERGGEVSH